MLQQPVQDRVPKAQAGAVGHTQGPTGSEAVAAAYLDEARRGVPLAWSKIYQAFFSMIYRRIRLLTGKMSVAEELTQETFVQAMLHVSKFRNDARFSTWLFGIAHNLVRNHWRSEQSTRVAHDRLETVIRLSPNRNVDERYLEQKRIEAIYAALETLPDTLRVVFVFRYFEGMSSAQIAETLNLSVNNVDARSSRARRRIKDILGEKGWLSNHASKRG